MFRSLIASALVLPLVGCVFFYEEECQYFEDTSEPVAEVGYLDPDTGQCQYFGGGGTVTGSCGEALPGGRIAQPDWALCESECTGLDEASCLTADGCRAGYIDECGPDADCDESAFRFYACWGTSASGPIQGECAGLDAWECSRHDDCAAIHYPDCYGEPNCDPRTADISRFELCMNERDPDTQPIDGNCYGEVFCESLPPDCPPNSIPGRANGCWTGQCIAVEDCPDSPPAACSTLTEDQCVLRADCAGQYEGIDCVCTPEGCTCANHVFQSCVAAG